MNWALLVLCFVLVLLLLQSRANYKRARRNAEAWQQASKRVASQAKWREYTAWLEAQQQVEADPHWTNRSAPKQ